MTALETQLARPLLFWISPGDTRCASRSDAAVAFSVIATMHVVAVWSIAPAVLPAGSLASVTVVAPLLLLQMAIVVATLAVRWTLVTYFVWSLSIWRNARVKQAVPYFGVVVMADAVTAAQMAVVSMAARFSDAGARSYLQAPRMGLDLVVAPASPLGAAFLSSVDGFAVWYGIIVTIGLEAACGIRRRDAILIVLLMWVISVALRVILPAVAG